MSKLVSPSYPRLRLYTRPATYLRIFTDVLTGRWKRGDAVERLERSIESRLGTRHAVAMPMARTGLYYAVKALTRPGQKVVLSPYTIADVINMVICAGAVPVFADLEPGGCNLSAAEVDRLIDEETGAVLVTHFYGEACDVEEIAAICRKRNVPLIEDAAQAFGVSVNGRPAGTFGDIGVFSFGMYKNVNAFYGGMLITSRDDVRDTVRDMVRDDPPETLKRYLPKVVQGLITDIITWPPIFRSFTFWLFRWAYLKDVDVITNQMKIDTDPKIKREIPDHYRHRMTPLQARLILGQLEGVEDAFGARVAHAKCYHEGFKDLDELTLPPLRTDGGHGYAYYCVQYPERGELVRFAQRNGRDIQESYHRNCAALPCFGNYQRDCPNAADVAASVIYLPAYPRYPVSEVQRTITVIRRFFEERHP